MIRYIFTKKSCMPVGTQVVIKNVRYTVTDFVISDDKQSVTYTVTAYDRFSPGGILDRRKLVKYAAAPSSLPQCA